jgi:hypothetical protein
MEKDARRPNGCVMTGADNMPVESFVDREHRLVRTHFSGLVTHREFSAYAHQLSSDPAFDAAFSELVTFADDSDIRLRFWDFQDLLHNDPFSESAKRAFVIPARDSVYGVMRIYQTVRRDSPNVRILETIQEAMAWLTEPGEEMLRTGTSRWAG